MKTIIGITGICLALGTMDNLAVTFIGVVLTLALVPMGAAE